MARGQRAALRKSADHRRKAVGDLLGIGDDQRIYELDQSALSTLPAKM